MIISYQDLAAGKTVGPVDVCIIGSGAGGSTMAFYLAQAGYSVVVLEKGGYFPSEELGRKEVALLTRTQAMTIFTPTTGEHTRVSLIAGECYGGGTLAAEGAAFDFPGVIKDDWEKLGLKSFSRSNPKLDTWMDELNQLLSVKPMAWEFQNRNNQLLAIAAEREGLPWEPSRRAVTYCLRCGNCTQGCRYGVKQDSAVTFLAWSREYQAQIFVGAKAEKIQIHYAGPEDQEYRERLQKARGAAAEDLRRELEQRAKQFPAKFTVTAGVTDRKAPPPRNRPADSKTLTVHARQLVLAAGPLGSSRLLMKSGINPHRVVGKRFSTHPSAFTLARFPKKVLLRGWDGMLCSMEIHHFGDHNRDQSYYQPERHGFLIEAALSLPWGMANMTPGVGREHLDRMRHMNYFGGCEMITKSDAYGEITPEEIKFEMSETDNERMLFGSWIMSRLMFRVGAQEVFTGLPGLVLKSPTQLDEIYKYRRGKKKGFLLKQANLYSGHIFGGCIMGKDPRQSFADETGECHEIKGLWVADGSAFPTNTGVNCLMSITLVARKIADDFIQKTQSSPPQ